MRMVLACACFFALFGAPASAQELSSSYARAIAAFNPAIGSRALDYARATLAAADRQGLDARLLVALIAVESRWHPAVVSPAGAIGLAQFMPETAAGAGIDPRDPQQSIDGAARHLRGLLERYAALDRGTQYTDAIAAYNAGAGAVDRYGGVPPYSETRAYVRDVILLWRRLSGVP